MRFENSGCNFVRSNQLYSKKMAMRIFLNQEKKIKNSWWVVIFFLLLSTFLFPLIMLADRFSFEITMAHQAIMIFLVSLICQFLRRQPMSELTGRINLTWIKELFTGILWGAALMILPVLLLTIQCLPLLRDKKLYGIYPCHLQGMQVSPIQVSSSSWNIFSPFSLLTNMMMDMPLSIKLIL